MDEPDKHGCSDSEDTFLRNYKLGKTLGHGSFGKVRIAEHVLTGRQVAIKILNREKIKEEKMEVKVTTEIEVVRLLMHPHIVRHYEVIETPKDIYVVMEYVENGELFDHIAQKGRLQEGEARKFFQQIISGVEHCHRNMVVHRDLKPENLLLDSKYNIKIADFGLSKVMHDGHLLKTSCGSPNYVAPEVISGNLYSGPEVDVWSCGIILYALLCGTLPFDDVNIPNLFKKIKDGIYILPSHLSDGVRDLIPRILVVDPMKRMTIPQICTHPWFQADLPCPMPPPHSTQQAKKIDEEILQDVFKIGFDCSSPLDSLQNKATVAYYLLLDNRLRAPSGYLGAEFQESMCEFCLNCMNTTEALCSPVRQRLPVYADYPQISVRENQVDRKWAFGLQSPARPCDIMTAVLKALQESKVCSESIGPYNLKCTWVPGIPGQHEGMINSSMHGNHCFGDESTIMENNGVTGSQDVVMFELQLNKTHEDKYLLHFELVQGPNIVFLGLCSAFLVRLQILWHKNLRL